MLCIFSTSIKICSLLVYDEMGILSVALIILILLMLILMKMILKLLFMLNL